MHVHSTLVAGVIVAPHELKELFSGINLVGMEGKQLKDMKLKPNTLVSFINRSGRIIIPTGSDSIEVGDSVMIVTKNKGFTTLTDIVR